MSNLENIPKKTIFNVPDGYFDKLPAEIQSRIGAKPANVGIAFVFRYGLQYALPLVIIAAILFYNTSSGPDAESILATVETSDLILYVQESGLATTDDLLENIDITATELEAIENEVYELTLEQTSDDVLELELNNL